MKTPAELLTDEFIERMLEDIPRMLPAATSHTGAEQFSRRADYRRLMRERIIERLQEHQRLPPVSLRHLFED